MNLPIYKVSISDNDNDEIEVDFIALVHRPAISKNFIAFSNHELKFAVTNEEERIVTGPVMIADAPIYRKTSDGEFYTVFDAATIKKIALRYFRKGYNKNLNIMHNPNLIAEGCYVCESWLIEPDKGKTATMGYEDITPGSWFISVKVDNPDIWNDVKAGLFKGFSVEGIFKLERMKEQISEEYSTEEMFNELKKLLQDHKG